MMVGTKSGRLANETLHEKYMIPGMYAESYELAQVSISVRRHTFRILESLQCLLQPQFALISLVKLLISRYELRRNGLFPLVKKASIIDGVWYVVPSENSDKACRQPFDQEQNAPWGKTTADLRDTVC